jgi:hypothetical protein
VSRPLMVFGGSHFPVEESHIDPKILRIECQWVALQSNNNPKGEL